MPKLLPLVFLTMSAGLFAQQPMFEKGHFEIAGSSGINRGELGGNLRFGAFVADFVQVGADLSYLDVDSYTRFHLGAYALRLFETGTYVFPYLGGGLAVGSLDLDGGESDSGLEVFVMAGLKYYLADNIALNTELYASYSSADTHVSDDKADDSDVGLRIGLSILW